MKGELLDNNKKKNMNIRLEDEREKNKKLKKLEKSVDKIIEM